MTIQELLQGKTPARRVRILYRILERLRLQHNARGDDFRSGVITEAEWKDFLVVWEKRFQRVANILNTVKENLNLFAEANLATAKTLKDEGKVLTTYDQDVDIETI